MTTGFDEAAHASYIAHLQHTGDVWPAFNDMRLLDTSDFHFTSAKNYLNHPSPYYLLLAHLGPNLEGHPGAIIAYRLFNVAITAIGLAALMVIGLVARLPHFTLYAYVVPLACIPVLVPIAGSINNDNAAFAGGAIATLAAFQLVSTGSRAWLVAALGGVIIASWAKLTGLLLAGGMIGGILAWLLWHGRLPPRWIVPITIAGLLAAAPYVAIFIQYGSPAPNTPGQIAMLKAIALDSGWKSTERMSTVAYAIHFTAQFATEWMPTAKIRTSLNYIALVIPVAAVLCAVVGILFSAQRINRRNDGPFDIVIVAGALAFTGTFIIHGIFSYERHIAFSWMTDAYPRYYLPLAAVIPLAGLSLVAAIKHQRTSAILVGFLIVGPIVFRVLGAPLA